MESALCDTLLAARERLARQHLLDAGAAALSLRLPGAGALLLLPGAGGPVRRIALDAATTPGEATPALHAAIYRLRSDVGAIASGSGYFGADLSAIQGAMPAIFDEQVRHLGRIRIAATAANEASLRNALADGANAALVDALAVCLGVNCQRMVLNVELFEKCAKAYVLALAAGGRITALPWWVRRIATGRLLRDEQRASLRFARGQLPEETHGY